MSCDLASSCALYFIASHVISTPIFLMHKLNLSCSNCWIHPSLGWLKDLCMRVYMFSASAFVSSTICVAAANWSFLLHYNYMFSWQFNFGVVTLPGSVRNTACHFIRIMIQNARGWELRVLEQNLMFHWHVTTGCCTPCFSSLWFDISYVNLRWHHILKLMWGKKLAFLSGNYSVALLLLYSTWKFHLQSYYK
jgi:hypothetical protein